RPGVAQCCAAHNPCQQLAGGAGTDRGALPWAGGSDGFLPRRFEPGAVRAGPGGPRRSEPGRGLWSARAAHIEHGRKLMPVSSSVGQAPLVSARRALVLTLVAACATMLLVTTSVPDRETIPHFATDDASFGVDGWAVGPAELSGRPDLAIVSLQYTSPSGRRFHVAISTSPEVKQIYRAGADVPFRGSGYVIESVPT